MINHPPYFLTSLKNPLKVGVNQEITYQFPEMADHEGDNIYITVNFGK
jgi:hypothetical protein